MQKVATFVSMSVHVIHLVFALCAKSLLNLISLSYHSKDYPWGHEDLMSPDDDALQALGRKIASFNDYKLWVRRIEYVPFSLLRAP